eukprot:CAMPEP_0196130374 /NCGR_PEP_ID=MMETSP0910-20130528/771_1 /TAXON_ID=49265 /ORGANISM="Thalassiosira rotula, Strain GSO102" /LENGTH=451 /DNA_ID=CAMNT_0041389669 /DNA_START=361 /DNA_END=1716 /DNA_ORIENTATION=+
MSENFTVKFSYKGKSNSMDNVSYHTTATELLDEVRNSFQVDDDIILRLIFKGKTIAQESVVEDDDNSMEVDGDATNNDSNAHPAFQPETTKIPKSKILKVIVMGSATTTNIQKLNSLRSDPLMRGFDDLPNQKSNNKSSTAAVLSTYWGPLHGHQSKQYKFCRFQECTDASFGSRPGSSTPHAWEARTLLEKLATDPGTVAIFESRELIVGTLGEMDPIDDRLMQKTASEGACLLGYNTNRGMRIDVKLRTDDLSGFRPYAELASTLIHELSHNWCGEHDVLFWTNFGQMRVEYLWEHARWMRRGGGKSSSTAALAEVTEMISPSIAKGTIARGSNDARNDDARAMMDNICQSVFRELTRDMAQHRLPVQSVAPAVLAFSRELMTERKYEDASWSKTGGQRLGGGDGTNSSPSASSNDGAAAAAAAAVVGMTPRERALAAAEKRAREKQRD